MNLLVTVLFAASFHASQRPHPPPQSRAEILLTSNKPARPVAASPYTLKTLRDLALVNDQLREAAAAVQPSAEAFALSDASVKELAALGASLQTSTSQLASSLGALSAAVKGGAADAPRVALDPLVRDDEVSTPASLKSLTLQASRLHQQVAEERQLIEILEEKERGAASRTTPTTSSSAAVTWRLLAKRRSLPWKTRGLTAAPLQIGAPHLLQTHVSSSCSTRAMSAFRESNAV